MKTIAALVAGALLVGFQSTAEANEQIFDAPLEHKLVKGAPLPVQTSDMTVTAVSEHEAFIYGGCDAKEQRDYVCESLSNSSYLFDSRTSNYTRLQDAPSKRMQHSAALRGRDVYIIGGVDATGAKPDVIMKYNLDSNTWSQLEQKLPIFVSDGAAFTLGDKIYFAGGFEGPNYAAVDTVFEIDSSDAVTNSSMKLKTARGDHRAVVIGNKAYLVGGHDATFAPVNNMEVFDGSSIEIHPSDLQQARGDMAVAAKDGNLYVAAGQSTDSLGGHETIEIYHPQSDSWIHGGELSLHRFRFDACTLGDSVFFFGGQTVDRLDNGTTVYTVLDEVIEYKEVHGIYSMPTVTLHGSGTTNPMKVFYAVMNIFEQQLRVPVKMTYRATGSGVGQKEFIGNEESLFLPYTQFGSGDIPFDLEDHQQMTRHGHQVAQVPFALGAIGMYANIPEQGDNQVELTACELAKIYKGDIINWKDLATSDRNAWLKDVDQPIYSLHRTKGSSSTAGITKYLHTQCPEIWDLGPNKVIDWPCDQQGSNCPILESADGSDGIQGTLESNPYSIGYLSVGHGYPPNLRSISLESEGTFQNPTDETIAAAAGKYDWPESVFDEEICNVDLVGVPGAYPIVLVSFVYIRQNLVSLGSSALLLQKFVEFILEKDLGQAMLPEFGFVALPENLQQKALSNIKNDLTLPDHLPVYSIEPASAAQAYTGAGAWTLSGRRKNHDFEYRDNVDQQLQTLKTSQDAMVSSVQSSQSELNQRVANLENAQNGQNGQDDHSHEQQSQAIAIAALAIGIVNFILLIIALVMVCKVKREASGHPVEEGRGPLERRNSEGSDISDSAAVRTVTKV